MSSLSSFLHAATVFGFVAVAGAGAAVADPSLLPSPPPVFCFAKTGADQIKNGNGIRIRFEILNWTSVRAYGLRLTANLNPLVSTGINAAANKMFGKTTPAPLFTPFPPATLVNNWTVASASQSQVTWAAGPPWIPPGPPNGSPLDPGNPLNPPIPINSGTNTLDGFILNLPFLGVYERVVFDWELLDQAGNRIAPAQDPLGYAFGAFQIDRARNASDGKVRQSSFVTASFSSMGLTGLPPLDPQVTDWNAKTDRHTGVVPVPASVWLLASALFGLFAGPWVVAAQRNRQSPMTAV